MLIVYEGFDDPKEFLPLNKDPFPINSSTDMDILKSRIGNQLRLIEDDSHSGNDADASNDSIELNLSLDEQQLDTLPTHHAIQTQSNHVSVSFYLFHK